ncbi:phosphate uptake regulator, PhoU [Ectothiorhodosinus mongolicus]|uniref:Phosphate-specific transport system accessory protein PhoU n=1 Tax=Ectothiorhodosinus mongolicus TaxID=233100 RepID=A0A1R3VW74_9GAMM|nr:phosphate signaling complex protein PhoU [Ectothiorhodosinus mongolicus]ULX56964.1 phosphate transport system regulatory protein PhoU [Ectothiorhodosinus mongolicus]SIT69208.1 phosphate uptake regulator, PhoU [Ectothiorhodosinus mongolicus]
MDSDFFKQHISQQFNAELEGIIKRIMAMGGLVEQQTIDAVEAMVTGNVEKAETVITSDYKINAMEVALDETCTQILARRQPTASDLRLVMAVIKAIADLERMGDEAERIGRMALHVLEKDREVAPMEEFKAMGGHVQQMIHNALDSFVRMDADQAVRAVKMDIQIDSLYEEIIRQLMALMREDPDSIPRVMDLVWATRALERIGDRAGNICEYVIYFVKGKDVRHTSFEQMAIEATGDGRE